MLNHGGWVERSRFLHPLNADNNGKKTDRWICGKCRNKTRESLKRVNSTKTLKKYVLHEKNYQNNIVILPSFRLFGHRSINPLICSSKSPLSVNEFNLTKALSEFVYKRCHIELLKHNESRRNVFDI